MRLLPQERRHPAGRGRQFPQQPVLATPDVITSKSGSMHLGKELTRGLETGLSPLLDRVAPVRRQ
jgi:hypothetical protein